MQKIFLNIHKFFINNKIVYYVLLLYLAIFVGIGLYRLELEENINSILPADSKVSQMTQLLNNSKFADQIIFTINTADSTGQSLSQMQTCAEKLNAVLYNDSLVKNIRLKVNNDDFMNVYDFLYKNIHLYLSDEDYARLDEKLTSENIDKTVESIYRTLISPTGIAAGKYMLRDPLAMTPVALEKLKRFQLDDNYEIENNFICTKDKRNLLFFLEPKFGSSDILQNSNLIKNIDAAVDSVGSQFPDLKIYYYGGTAVAVANANRIKSDILITVSLAFLFLTILFYAVFRRIRVIALLFFPIMMGAGIAISVLTFIESSISSIALSVGAALAGMSVDYSLHLFTHLRASRSVENTIKDIAEPVIMSCLTTIAAFLCLYILDSDALRQLGLFVSITIFSVATLILTLVPILFSKINMNLIPQNLGIFDKVAAYKFHCNKPLVVSVILLSGLFWVTSRWVTFNSDISAVNYMSPNLIESEKHLRSISSETYRSIYAVFVGNDLDEALRKAESKENLFNECRRKEFFNTMSATTDLMLSIESQQKSICRWNEFWQRHDVDSIRNMFIESGRQFNFKEKAFAQFFDNISSDKKIISIDDYKPLCDMFLSNYILQADSLSAVVAIMHVEQQKCASLISEIESCDNEIIIVDKGGMVSKIFDSLKVNFNTLSSASMAMIFIILLIFFGRIELALITFIPISISWVWTLGLMGLLGIEFNIFNIIVSTFIFGLGIDYCIFITRGMMNNYKYGNKPIEPYKMSILLSSLTTIGAMGVLLFARHAALRSIAFVSVVGIFSVLLIANVLIPLFFDWLTRHQNQWRKRPITAFDFCVSILGLSAFVVGAIFMTLLIPIVSILPLPRRKVKFLYHQILCVICKIVVRVNITFKLRFIDRQKINFNRPSVIICNHQSHLDLVLLLMQNPRIVVLTNSWVWNSPIIGSIVRFSGCCPVYEGFENHIDTIRQRIADGYSILVFPEGTRTVDGSIGRFHRGAFDIAAQLGLPIQPIVIHGAYQCLPKNEFFMRSGNIELIFLDAINIENHSDDPMFLHNKTKEICEFFRQKYLQICQQYETPDFYFRALSHKYIFKNPVLEWYMKVKVRMEDKYKFFDNLIPRQAKITDIGCGYGFLVNMLAMVSSKRVLRGYDYDSQKIAVAQQTAVLSPNVEFAEKNIVEDDIEPSDVFLLCDILHYMSEADQMRTLEKCFDKLNHGGMVIVRDANADMLERTKVTKLTELFSTKLLNFNKTQGELTFISGQKIIDIARKHNLQVEVVDNARYTSNLTYIIKA